MTSIKITTTDATERQWSIVATAAAVGFAYSVTCAERETDKGWTEQQFTAGNVGKLLHWLIGFHDSEVDDWECEAETSRPCPMCDGTWSGSREAIAEQEAAFERYVNDNKYREQINETAYDAEMVLLPTREVGPDGRSWDASRLWIYCPLCRGDVATGIVALEGPEPDSTMVSETMKVLDASESARERFNAMSRPPDVDRVESEPKPTREASRATIDACLGPTWAPTYDGACELMRKAILSDFVWVSEPLGGALLRLSVEGTRQVVRG